MTNEQQAQIIQNITQEVEDKGSSRVGYHADQILKEEYEGKAVPYNIKSKIEGKITANKKYRSRPHPKFDNDFEITLNPDYKEQTWEEKHPLMDRVRTGAITAVFTLLVGLTVYFITANFKKERDSVQDQQINSLYDSLTKINAELKKATAKKDTTK